MQINREKTDISLTVSISKEDDQRIKAFAKEHNISRAQVVRAAVRNSIPLTSDRSRED